MTSSWTHEKYPTYEIAKKSNSLYSPMVANVLKFGWDQMKTVEEVVFWKFKSHMVLCLEKIQKAPENF